MYCDRYGTSNVIDNIVTHKSIKTDKYQHLIHCWSSTALLEVIRKTGRYELQMYEGRYYFEANEFMTESYFNPVDACFEIVCWLKKNGK